ncbi:Cytochrome oxidase assembly protein ShyY1 [Ruaniaceae bacterium KH17]|nr:Cytochrome oxidase assembly protein ShyY1 [Ruaniaceae bacterium KH17]
MITLLILLAAAAVVCAQLGAWQLDRAAIRGASEAQQIEEERLAADPVPLESVLRVGDLVTKQHKLIKAEVTGEWGEQFLIADRLVDGAPAYLVLTELRLTEGPDAGAMIPVLRGWMTEQDVAAAGGAQSVPVPTGEASLIGYIHEDEKAASGDFPPGQIGAISVGQLLNLWGGPAFSGYLVAVDAVGGGVETLPAPSYSEGEGLNLRNLLYAGEWFLFGGFALFLWWRMVRDEAAHLREDQLIAEAEERAAAG